MRSFIRFSTLLAGACAALLCASSAVAAPRYAAPNNADLQQADADGLTLRAGEFAWLSDPNVPSDAPVTIMVNLSAQRAYLYRDGRRIAITTVSTGRRGHDTPTGVFPIMGKERMHHSNRYDNAPMPWMQRLTRWGHALHAGHVRAFPASHGCIRLPAEFARQLYSLTKPGDLVIISEDNSPRALAIAFAIAGMDSRIALAVGVTEPLPRIVFVESGQERAPTPPVEGGAGNSIAF